MKTGIYCAVSERYQREAGMTRRYKLVVVEEINGKTYEAVANFQPIEIETANFNILMHAWESLEHKMDDMKHSLSTKEGGGDVMSKSKMKREQVQKIGNLPEGSKGGGDE